MKRKKIKILLITILVISSFTTFSVSAETNDPDNFVLQQNNEQPHNEQPPRPTFSELVRRKNVLDSEINILNEKIKKSENKINEYEKYLPLKGFEEKKNELNLNIEKLKRKFNNDLTNSISHYYNDSQEFNKLIEKLRNKIEVLLSNLKRIKTIYEERIENLKIIYRKEAQEEECDTDLMEFSRYFQREFSGKIQSIMPNIEKLILLKDKFYEFYFKFSEEKEKNNLISNLELDKSFNEARRSEMDRRFNEAIDKLSIEEMDLYDELYKKIGVKIKDIRNIINIERELKNNSNDSEIKNDLKAIEFFEILKLINELEVSVMSNNLKDLEKRDFQKIQYFESKLKDHSLKLTEYKKDYEEKKIEIDRLEEIIKSYDLT